MSEGVCRGGDANWEGVREFVDGELGIAKKWAILSASRYESRRNEGMCTRGDANCERLRYFVDEAM
jgi:hypothetical protein